jgi:hypothetical protein
VSGRPGRGRPLLAALAVASLALGVATARADLPGHLATHVDNPYWSGYVVTSPGVNPISYTRVTGTWKEPRVTCGHRTAGDSSAVWVGLGGYGTRTLEQVGVNANCDAKGRPFYFAWYEVVPDIARNIHARVFPGDTITATVRMIGLDVVALRVKDRTRHWMFARRINWGSADNQSAEWVTEAPTNCRRFDCRVASLANFGKVGFRDIEATGNGTSGTLRNPAWAAIRIRLVPGVQSTFGLNTFVRAVSPSSHAGATPGHMSRDGSAFGISWIANEPRPAVSGGRR